MIQLSGKVIVTITNNGKGFDMHLEKVKNGLGLKSLEERAKLFGAKAETDSSPVVVTKTHFLINIP